MLDTPYSNLIKVIATNLHLNPLRQRILEVLEDPAMWWPRSAKPRIRAIADKLGVDHKTVFVSLYGKSSVGAKGLFYKIRHEFPNLASRFSTPKSAIYRELQKIRDYETKSQAWYEFLDIVIFKRIKVNWDYAVDNDEINF